MKSGYQAKVLRFCHLWQEGQQQFIVQTSGSTGAPKPMTLTRKQMQASAYMTGKTFGLNEGDKVLICLNVDFIAGMMMLVRGIELDLQMTVIEPVSNPLLCFSSQDSFDFTALVPLQLQTILEESPEKTNILNGMKAIIVGGAAVNESLLAKIQSLTVPVFSTYGMTETVTHIAVCRLNGATKKDYFSTLEGVDIGVDESNCLKIKGLVTNELWIQTNDIVEVLNERHFRLIGRLDNVINSGGVKIQLEKVERIIENCLFQQGQIRRFFAFGQPDERLGQQLVVVFEGQPIDNQTLDEINFSLNRQLNRYEVPKKWYFVEKFSETPTTKVDKKATFAQLTFL